jgi:hypothetical protein
LCYFVSISVGFEWRASQTVSFVLTNRSFDGVATLQVISAQQAGAIGVVYVSTVAGRPVHTMKKPRDGTDKGVTLPVVNISMRDGSALISMLAGDSNSSETDVCFCPDLI